MTLSRMTVTAYLLLIAAAAAAAPDPVTAEELVQASRQELQVQLGLKCPKQGEGDEIIVCGRRSGEGRKGSEFRIPYVAEPGRRIPGEPSSDGGGCIRLCHQPVTIPLHKIGPALARIMEALED